MLIKSGMAKLITTSEDILVEYNIVNKSNRNNNIKNIFADKIEEEIYNILISENFTINELINKIGLDTTTISLKISMMEIKKIIKK